MIRPVKGLNFQWRIKTKKKKKKNHLKSDCGIKFGGFERFPFLKIFFNSLSPGKNEKLNFGDLKIFIYFKHQ